MASVGQKNTGPEMRLRSALHHCGLRYRLHDRRLPGSPDLVLPKFQAVIFVHGCYWHRHDCYRATIPKSRPEFWEQKFLANKARDLRNIEKILELKRRVLIVWECALIGKTARTPEVVAHEVFDWLNGFQLRGEIVGNPVDKSEARHSR